MKAARLLRAAAEGNADIPTDQLYDVVLLATGDKVEAEATYRARLHADLRASSKAHEKARSS